MVAEKQTSDMPIMRVSNDNGATFGPVLTLAINGTIGASQQEEEMNIDKRC
jgi:hypothetical protein